MNKTIKRRLSKHLKMITPEAIKIVKDFSTKRKGVITSKVISEITR